MYWGPIQPKSEENEKELEIHPGVIDMPKDELMLASCSYILGNIYGFKKSVEKGMAVDRDGQYIPLYTYPTIEYLRQFDLSKKVVFEFGGGASTLYWMERAEKVYTVENNAKWYEKLKAMVNNNVELLYAAGEQFPKVIKSIGGRLDLIVVDGAGYRYDCARFAVECLSDNGVIILDNADWHPNTAKMLKNSGLLQVDMYGFKPTESHTSTTSLFLKRNFDFPTRQTKQPAFGWGAKELHSDDWDKQLLD
ncbi:hypothetical protein HMF8227_00857 [Saliniradius amylolyticus]|uniref:SAM-dependent methyltransferase n=1 Tax=Saliniradius amylolyticus TaxID=2183582 RepID=A0A2S2E1F4_9ALTE|nr:SAM-dependent methyltransferase [Saliniradius amylolyticus]AWL11352.1 hypothetical protein HMF8227_00857 [Saliniradius amylolyticus]